MPIDPIDLEGAIARIHTGHRGVNAAKPGNAFRFRLVVDTTAVLDQTGRLAALLIAYLKAEQGLTDEGRKACYRQIATVLSSRALDATDLWVAVTGSGNRLQRWLDFAAPRLQSNAWMVEDQLVPGIRRLLGVTASTLPQVVYLGTDRIGSAGFDRDRVGSQEAGTLACLFGKHRLPHGEVWLSAEGVQPDRFQATAHDRLLAQRLVPLVFVTANAALANRHHLAMAQLAVHAEALELPPIIGERSVTLLVQSQFARGPSPEMPLDGINVLELHGERDPKELTLLLP